MIAVNCATTQSVHTTVIVGSGSKSTKLTRTNVQVNINASQWRVFGESISEPYPQSSSVTKNKSTELHCIALPSIGLCYVVLCCLMLCRVLSCYVVFQPPPPPPPFHNVIIPMHGILITCWVPYKLQYVASVGSG